MKKFKIFISFEKEENYLNAMALKGWEMKHYSLLGFYTFKKSNPQNLTYRIDYRVFKSRKKYSDYLNFLSDTGWKHVGGSYWSGNHYFLPKSERTETLELFSDESSKQQRVKTLFQLCLSCLCLGIAYSFLFASLTHNYHYNLLDPKSWYLTPNLWSQTGLRFTFSFLFETPFVFLRVGIFYFFILYTLFFAYLSFAVYRKNRSTTRGYKTF